MVAMPDKPVHPLTLYRLTLETDDNFTFEYLINIFRNRKYFISGADLRVLNGVRKNIIGVESRIRERME